MEPRLASRLSNQASNSSSASADAVLLIQVPMSQLWSSCLEATAPASAVQRLLAACTNASVHADIDKTFTAMLKAFWANFCDGLVHASPV